MGSELSESDLFYCAVFVSLVIQLYIHISSGGVKHTRTHLPLRSVMVFSAGAAIFVVIGIGKE